MWKEKLNLRQQKSRYILTLQKKEFLLEKLKAEKMNVEIEAEEDDSWPDSSSFCQVGNRYSSKGSFRLDTAVCRFYSGLCQQREMKFSISLQQRNHLPETVASNGASVNGPLFPKAIKIRKNYAAIKILFSSSNNNNNNTVY